MQQFTGKYEKYEIFVSFGLEVSLLIEFNAKQVVTRP